MQKKRAPFARRTGRLRVGGVAGEKGMIHRIPVAAASKRMPARSTASVNGRALSALAMACLFLAGCASPGAVSSPLASDQNPPAKADAAMRPASDAGTGVGPSSAVAQDTVLLQRRRQAIAEMLEGNIAYRTLLDVKLTDAKLAGPYVVVSRNLFSGSAYEDRYYCATANLDLPYWPLPYPRTAVVRVKPAENGSENLRAAIGLSSPPSECSARTINYVPFPEMEQLRARRRQALGKAD